MVGGRSQQTPSINRLTSLPDSVLSKCRRSRHFEFQHIKRRHRPAWNCTVLEWRIATPQRFKVVLYLSGVCQHHVLFRESNHDNRSRLAQQGRNHRKVRSGPRKYWVHLKGALASGVFGSNSYHPPIRRDEVGILAPPKDDPRHEVGLLAPPKGYPGSGVLGVHSGDSGGSEVRGDSSAGYGVHGSSEAPNHSGVLGNYELRKGQTIKYPSYGVFGFQIGNVRGAGVRGESSSGDGVIGVTHSEKKNGVVGIIETGPGSMNIRINHLWARQWRSWFFERA